MTRLKRFRARFKQEKCKYKRCGYRRTHPVEEPKYCVKHVDIVNGTLTIGEIRKAYADTLEKEEKPTLKQRIKSFIFVDK